MKRFLLYEARWVSSTPVLALCLYLLADLGPIAATIIANLIGGALFFWVDKIIFREDK